MARNSGIRTGNGQNGNPPPDNRNPRERDADRPWRNPGDPAPYREREGSNLLGKTFGLAALPFRIAKRLAGPAAVLGILLPPAIAGVQTLYEREDLGVSQDALPYFFSRTGDNYAFLGKKLWSFASWVGSTAYDATDSTVKLANKPLPKDYEVALPSKASLTPGDEKLREQYAPKPTAAVCISPALNALISEATMFEEDKNGEQTVAMNPKASQDAQKAYIYWHQYKKSLASQIESLQNAGASFYKEKPGQQPYFALIDMQDPETFDPADPKNTFKAISKNEQLHGMQKVDVGDVCREYSKYAGTPYSVGATRYIDIKTGQEAFKL